MKVHINIANNLKQSAYLTFEKIKENINQNHYIIVPDRFSVTVEKQILKQLQKNCCFNIEVLPLSRLCNRFIKDENKKLLSKNQSIMLIKKCILNCADKLECFKNSSKTENFSESIFETIMQLKSCNITPDQLTLNNKIQKSLQFKLNDIKLIYEQYEQQLKTTYIDSFNKLNLFCQNMHKYAELKSYNLHFVYFEAFTPLILKVINSLMQHCKSVNFGICSAYKKQNNKNIYSTKTVDSVILEAKSLDIQPTFSVAEQQLGVQNFLRENLYSYNNKSTVCSTMAPLLVNFTSIQNEVEFICADIKRKVIENNLRYNQFVIACANPDQYFELLRKQLTQFDISFYIDQAQSLNKTVLWNLISNCINAVINYDNKTYIFDIIDNSILNLDNNEINIFKNFCNKYNIKNIWLKFNIGTEDDNFEICENIRQFVCNLLINFKEMLSQDITESYCEILINFLKNSNFAVIYDNFIQKLSNFDKVQYQVEQQALDKLIDILTNIQSILGAENISLLQWFEILSSGVTSSNISILPLSVDGVFVGDISNSVFDNADFLYICGATQSTFPIIKQDVGIISDYEINSLNQKMLIEPSIRTINQRTRLKCIDLVSSFNISLTITYSIIDMSANTNSISEITKQISSMINVFNSETQSFTPTPILTEEMLNYSFNNLSIKEVCYKYVNQTNATSYIVNCLKQNYLNENEKIIYSYLLENNNNFNLFSTIINNNFSVCENANKLFFKNKSTSISEIECYFACPFKHFVRYGLKLQENYENKQLAMNIGNILHGVAEKFVKYQIKNNFEIDENSIKNISYNFFNQSIIDNKLQNVIQNPENKLLIKDLINESERLCLYLHNSTQKTLFKPTLVEQSFGNANSVYKEIKIDIDNKQYFLKGKIDRVDEFNNSFRIVDYKTGSTSFDFNQLYYGEKVQLFIYQKAIFDQTGQSPVGIFYLPVVNRFAKDEKNSEELYKLDGLIIDDLQTVLQMDTSLNADNLKSSIIPVSIKIDKKTNEISVKNTKNTVKSDILLQLSNYAYEICKIAIKEMQQNYIQPKPIKDGMFSSCSSCEYKAICRFNETTDQVRTKNINAIINKEEQDA